MFDNKCTARLKGYRNTICQCNWKLVKFAKWLIVQSRMLDVASLWTQRFFSIIVLHWDETITVLLFFFSNFSHFTVANWEETKFFFTVKMLMVMTVLALRKIHPVKAIPYGESVTRVMLALGDCRPSTWHLARKINSKSFLRLSYEIHCRHADFTNDSTNNFFSFFFCKIL